MKIRFVLLLAICAALAVPAMADNLYDNGPLDNFVTGWTLNFGYSVSDSMQLNGTVQGFVFWAALFPGDTLTSAQLSISSSPFGTDLFNSVVDFTQSNCVSSAFGFNLCEETTAFSGPTLNGNYWLTLQNATVPDGDPIYWDQNSGVGCQSPGCPSLAQESALGTIPSEAFTVMGTPGTSTTSTGTTPEPGGLVLFGSGALGVVGMLRRKLIP